MRSVDERMEFRGNTMYIGVVQRKCGSGLESKDVMCMCVYVWVLGVRSRVDQRSHQGLDGSCWGRQGE